ncbi:hypothetical protein B0H34DRAFT_685784 [Crassisporium funariophilum]|nr:hypothetical protein B0H34DRAFT_685784 [Crassisporium funariophilum]
MQAQHYGVPVHPQYCHNIQSIHPPMSDPYLAQDGGLNFTNGFSRGSSFTYPHPDYRYLLDRGELASRLCATSLVNDNALDATGMGFAGNPSSNTNFVAPEDISVYQQQQTWDWTGVSNHAIVAPAPIYPAPVAESPAYLGIKSSRNQGSSVVRSPAAQLPTPAAMAILLNPNARSEGELSQSGYEIPSGSTVAVSHHTATAMRPSIHPAVEPVLAVPDCLSREKKHACTMCHKRFDRPSTLRKHLLVHTGEKAFVCDTCGRRFGVASNLNRHVKRCILKPVNSPSSSSLSASGSPSAPTDSPITSPLVSSLSAVMPPQESSVATTVSTSGPRTGKRVRPPPSPTESASPSSNSSNAQSPGSAPPTRTTKPPGQKRRRRAPSPSQWVPLTLQNFNLLSDDSYRIMSVPLPPVRRNPPKEERDSWDENINQTPYHPCGWSGILPGPGLGQGFGLHGKDVRNMNFGGRGGFMLGRVLVF